MSEWLMSEWAAESKSRLSKAGPKPAAMPDPPLKNPYMEGIEAIEAILLRLHSFTKEFPDAIDKRQVDAYTVDMLEVRDALHRFRQQEMEGV